MSSPEKAVITPEGRKVLAQDLPQYERSVYPARVRKFKKEKKEFDTAKSQYEKDLAAYEKEKAEFERKEKEAQRKYEKELAEFEKKFKSDYGISYDVYQKRVESLESKKEKYSSEIKKLEEQKKQAVQNVPTTETYQKRVGSGGGFPQGDDTDKWVTYTQPKGRKQLKIDQSRVAKKFDTKIQAKQFEAKRDIQRTEFSVNYPNVQLGGTWFRDWQKQIGLKGSGVGTLEQEYEKELKRRGMQAAEARSQSIRKMLGEAATLQKEYQTDKTAYANQIGEIKSKAEQIKAPDPLSVRKVRRDVLPGETVKDTKQRYKNPDALIMQRPTKEFEKRASAITATKPSAVAIGTAQRTGGLTPATKIAPRTGVRFVTLDPFKDIRTPKPTPIQKERAVLSEFLSGYKGTAPLSAGLLAGIVEEKTGRPITPQTKEVISDIARQPQTKTFVRSGTITDPKTGARFNPITGEGSSKIALALGYNLNYNVPRPKVTETTTQYYVLPATTLAGKPQVTDLSKLTYSEMVERGIAKSPQTLADYARYYTSRAERPITGILDSLGVGGKYRQEQFSPSTFDRAIGNAADAITGKKPISEGLKETYQYAKKDPFGVVVEAPAEIGLGVIGGKVIQYGASGAAKIGSKLSKLVRPITKEVPKIDSATNKIYPNISKQKQLTQELINRPIVKPKAFSEIKVSLGKGQPQKVPDYLGGRGKIRPEIDPEFKPTRYATEIKASQKLDDVLTDFKTTKVGLGRATGTAPNITPKPKKVQVPFEPSRDPSEIKRMQELDDVLAGFKERKIELGKGVGMPPKEPKFTGKKPEPVKLDPGYTPTRRASEIRKSQRLDDVLADFKTQRIGLGRGTVRTPPEPKFTGKKPEPVRLEEGYKPRGRFEGGFKDIFKSDTEIAGFTSQKVSLGKTVIRPPTEAKITKIPKQQKKKPFEFEERKTGLGEGGVIESGKLQLLTKAKQVSKTKLVTERKQPIPADYTRVETAPLVPPTGKAPITLKTVTKKLQEKRKKPTVAATAVAMEYETVRTPVQSSREIVTTLPKLGFATLGIAQTPLVSAKTIVVPRVREKTKSRLQEKVKQIGIIKPLQVEKTVQKQTTPSRFPFKTPQRTVFKQPQRPQQLQSFAFEPPRRPRNVQVPVTSVPKRRDSPKPKSFETFGGKKYQFLGNVPETQVSGIFKRQEITYGLKRTRKLSLGDVRVTKGLKRATKRKTTWYEGKKSDPFVFKNETKKIQKRAKKKGVSFW